MQNMRRKDREMPREFAEAVTDKCLYAVLSTVGQDGSPYGVPLSIVREGDWVYFHCAQAGRKLDNLRYRDRVCLVCVGDVREPPDHFTVEYESAIIFGRAEEVEGAEEKTRILRLLCERHTPANMGEFAGAIEQGLTVTGVWKIRIENITGKRRILPVERP
jgi:nitroimidazol reductase NimA-like FMN-containing flavoprotein (pyridoxamine 5'-phosphate oxidase superfamily)